MDQSCDHPDHSDDRHHETDVGQDKLPFELRGLRRCGLFARNKPARPQQGTNDDQQESSRP